MSQKSKGVYESARFRTRIMERLVSPPFYMPRTQIAAVFGFLHASAVTNALRRSKRRK